MSDPWTFLILREAMFGRRTFAEFGRELGIASDVLTARLNTLVEHGALTRIPYRAPGQRTRHSYELTEAGGELKVVLVALRQWGDRHLAASQTAREHQPRSTPHGSAKVAFVDDEGLILDADAVPFAPSTVQR